MKKTYFIYTYRTITNLLILALLTFIFHMLTGYFANLFLLSDVTFISQLEPFTRNLSHYFEYTTIISLYFASFLIMIECINRFIHDTIKNYVSSIYHTQLLRHFLWQSERLEKIQLTDSHSITSYNPIHKSFNRAIRKSVCDIRKETILITIKIPRTQQAQKVLSDMENQLKEEISNLNPDFYFSSPTRDRRTLYITGKKRS